MMSREGGVVACCTKEKVLLPAARTYDVARRSCRDVSRKEMVLLPVVQTDGVAQRSFRDADKKVMMLQGREEGVVCLLGSGPDHRRGDKGRMELLTHGPDRRKSGIWSPKMAATQGKGKLHFLN
ncbi:phospholipase d1 [Sesbania bispinosa]|nr:phospholipase d1 [Sesbania bispinosa]